MTDSPDCCPRCGGTREDPGVTGYDSNGWPMLCQNDMHAKEDG